jgi:hypothetical protein
VKFLDVISPLTPLEYKCAGLSSTVAAPGSAGSATSRQSERASAKHSPMHHYFGGIVMNWKIVFIGGLACYVA